VNFSFYIARRYLVSKNGKNAINIINILSFIITVVGTAALFIVLSGFSGLKDFSTAFSSYFDPDLQVTPLTGKVVEIPLSRKRELQQIQGVEEVRLSLTVNNYSDYLQIMVPKPGKNAINMMNYKNSFSQINVLVSDLFSVNENLDSNYIFSTITAARTLLHLDEDSASGVAIKLSSDANESSVRTAITAIMGDDIIIKNKLQLNDALYKMLNSENLAVYLIFTLVLIIALFNVIGSIIMMILDKKKNLKTLLDLGASIKDLRKVFFIQGSLMTITGGIIGLLIGITIVSIQLHFKLIYIAPELPYPFAMRFSNIIVALGTIAILGIIASYIASKRINDTLIAQAKL